MSNHLEMFMLLKQCYKAIKIPKKYQQCIRKFLEPIIVQVR